MMKYIFGFILLSSFNLLSAQENEIEMASILSPNGSNLVDTNNISDVTVSIQNKGPRIILASDTILFNVTFATNESTINRLIKKKADTFIQLGSLSTYTLINDFKFDTNRIYTVCADVIGTKAYPNNISKNKRQRCITFLVNAAEYILSLNKVFYANGQLNFHLSENLINADAMVLDITGKQLIRKRLNNAKNQALEFQPYAKGFYFIKIIESNGRATVSKFVIN